MILKLKKEEEKKLSVLEWLECYKRVDLTSRCFYDGNYRPHNFFQTLFGRNRRYADLKGAGSSLIFL